MYSEVKSILRPMIFTVIWALLASVFASFSSIALMGLSAWLIASASLQPPLYTLSLAILGVRCCGIMRAVLRYADRYLTHKAGFMLFGRLRLQVMYRVAAALPFRRQSTAGDVFDAIAEALDNLRDSVLRFALPPLAASLITWTVSLWLSFYDVYLPLLMMTAWIVFALIIPLIGWHLYKKHGTFSLELTQDVIDLYNGRSEALFYGYTAQRLNKARGSAARYQMQRRKVFYLKSSLDAISEVCLGLFWTVAIALLICCVQKGLSAVAAVCIMLTMQAVLEILMVLPGLAEHMAEAKKSWQQLQPFYKTQAVSAKSVISAHAGGTAAADANIVFKAEGVSFGYGGRIVCRDLNFCLKKGRRTLLLGASGCGKSTLLYAMLRLLPLQTGSMFLQGRPYSSLADESVRSHFAASLQEHHIFNMSVRDNFKMFHPDISDEEIVSSLNKAGMADFAGAKTLDFMLSSGGSNLSGGQCHRLQLAVCMARSRDIVLLDEPTAGLDIGSAKAFLRSITADAAKSGATLLVTSHDLSLIEYFDDVIIMRDGRIAEQGSIKNLLKNENSLLFNHFLYDNLL